MSTHSCRFFLDKPSIYVSSITKSRSNSSIENNPELSNEENVLLTEITGAFGGVRTHDCQTHYQLHHAIRASYYACQLFFIKYH